jgi:uncharacterized integral membrane protein
MGRWIVLLLVALVGVVLAAFTIQNSGFRVPLQLDLYFGAWKLSDPAPASALVWSGFGAGLLLGGGWGLIRSSSLSRKVSRLEQEIALGPRTNRDGWAG